MNTAHTPQALSLPHLQIAEPTARRDDEIDAFERAAAALQPTWLRAERSSPPAAARAEGPLLGKVLRQNAVARVELEADRYRRQMLGDLARNDRYLRGLFIAAVVMAAAVLGLSDRAVSSAPAPATSGAAPAALAAPAASTAQPAPAAPQAKAGPVARAQAGAHRAKHPALHANAGKHSAAAPGAANANSKRAAIARKPAAPAVKRPALGPSAR